jgi:TIR domain
MKVFISWSGVASRSLAEALHEWIPKVIQGIQPFISTKNIDKGDMWASVINTELKDTSFGVVCLTAENLVSPWLSYEAGAIASAVSSRVCPVLLGITKADVKPPLSQLQLTELTLQEVTQLMDSINTATENPLDSAAVREATETWWPKLQNRISSIELPDRTESEASPEPEKPRLTNEDAFEEILRAVRSLERRIERTETRSRLPRHFTRERREESIEQGKDELAHQLGLAGIPLQLLTLQTLTAVATDLKIADVISLYAAVGEGHISARSVVEHIIALQGTAED